MHMASANEPANAQYPSNVAAETSTVAVQNFLNTSHSLEGVNILSCLASVNVQSFRQTRTVVAQKHVTLLQKLNEAMAG
jgi:hypothetical protein